MNRNYYEYLVNFNNVSKEQLGGGVYVDNALNRRLGRVGQSYGKTKKVDMIGCQIKPEQFKISKDEHGSIYLLTIASATCKLLGAYLYHICPIWVYPSLPSICNKTSK